MGKLKFDDFVTYTNNEEDVPYLRTKLLDVNLRLLKSSIPYKNLVNLACEYIKFMCSNEMAGYKKPHGMSGANLAIPWNIIAYLENRDKQYEKCIVMINPKIINYLGNILIASSNCGSIRLKDSVPVERYERIDLQWFDLQGMEHRRILDRDMGSFTIQHEVDHNKGILITDRVPDDSEPKEIRKEELIY